MLIVHRLLHLTHLGSLLSEHFITLLVLLDLAGQLFDFSILYPELELNVAVEESAFVVHVRSVSGQLVDSHRVLSDLLLESVLLLDLVIDLEEQVDVLVHDLAVLLLVISLVLAHQ